MTSDAQLLDQWTRSGDPYAFREIAFRYAPMLYAACMRVLGNRTDAEDVVQECFEVLVRTDSRPREHLGAWLHRVATNRALDRIRSDQRRKAREAVYVAEASAPAEQDWPDIYQYVDEAIEELPDELRIPTVAHFLQNESVVSIARSLGINRRTVSRRMNTALELIVQSLRSRGVLLGGLAVVSVMSASLANAAPIPASLSASLGKLVLANALHSPLPSAGIGVLGGSVFAKAAIVCLLTASAVVAGWWAARQERSVDSVESVTARSVTPISEAIQTVNATGNEVVDEWFAENVESTPARRTKDSGTETQNSSSTNEATAIGGTQLTGHVMDSRGSPVAGATLSAHAIDADQTISGTSEKTGAYVLSGLGPGLQFFVDATATGFALVRKTIITPADGEPQSLDIVLAAAGSLDGRVVDLTGKPLPDVFVRIESIPDEPGSREPSNPPLESRADAQGHFTAVPLGRGAFHFLVTGPTYAVEALNEPLITMEGQKITGMDVVVPVGGDSMISGYVTDPRGIGMADVTVLAESIYGFHREEDGSFNRATTQTDSSGFYRVDGVLDPADLTFQPPALSVYTKAWLSSIAPGTSDANVVLYTGGAVRGTIVDTKTARPLGESTVKIWRHEGQDGSEAPSTAFRSVPADAPGQFEFQDVAPGVVELLASAPGHAARIVSGIVVEPNTTNDLRIELGAPCVLEGRVRVNGRAPNAAGYGYSLEIYSEEYPTLTNRMLSECGSEEGDFRLGGLPEGTVLARVSFCRRGVQRFRISRQSLVTLRAGETAFLDVDLEGEGRIFGSVIAPPGSTRCVVMLYDLDQMPERPRDCLIYGQGECRIQGTQGTYELGGLEPGTYVVTAYSADVRYDYRRSESRTVSIQWGEQLELDFDLTASVSSGIPLRTPLE